MLVGTKLVQISQNAKDSLKNLVLFFGRKTKIMYFCGVLCAADVCDCCRAMWGIVLAGYTLTEA